MPSPGGLGMEISQGQSRSIATELRKIEDGSHPFGSDIEIIDAPHPEASKVSEATATALGNRSSARRRRRIRRILGLVIQVWSRVECVAVWPGIGALGAYLPFAGGDLSPLAVFVAATGLHFLGRGIRRGQREALVIAITMFIGTGIFMTMDHRAFGGVVSSIFIVMLVTTRHYFPASYSTRSLQLGFALAIFGIGAGILVENWHTPYATTMGLAIAVYTTSAGGWLITRPTDRTKEPVGGVGTTLAQARHIVSKHGSDALSFFSLRYDKLHFFHGETVIAYAFIRNVCIVSPDPIGPPNERHQAWGAFRSHAELQGWPVGVLGASDDWLPIYRQSGMSSVYLGDDAVVHCPTFELAGRRFKSLRQAVNRAAKRGHTVKIYDPRTVSYALREELKLLVRDSRQGEHERGFSMTLSRLFHDSDSGLLLGVCFDSNRRAVACCQFVPTTNGYCLDLMRRKLDSNHGVIDLVVVRMIEMLGANGVETLTLNFVAWREILAEERPNTIQERILRKGIGWLSQTFQIDSLWQYNKKYNPHWLRRHAAHDGIEELIPSLLAVAKAESYSEIPLIGRFMKPDWKASWELPETNEDGVIDLRKTAT